MNLMRAPAAMLAVLLLAGCAGHEPATGQVTGRLLSQGGGSPGQRPMPGTVAFTAAGHVADDGSGAELGDLLSAAAARPLSRFRALLRGPFR